MSSVEEVFSSKGRVKVLKVLSKFGELNISEIARRAGLNHATTASHLSWLKQAGLVEEKNFGRIRIFRFKIEDPRARAIKELFDSFSYLEV
ncbi:MAG: winged helix-turn-helix transcriptional regulator [Candidatus Verstraetearchaeota archaeon]|nr:winged helix-turn-helix transcriptional regulator [Candidatus Verstraetearchaeota archaeon]